MEATFLSILWKVLFAAISIIGFYTVFCWFKMSDQEVCPEKVSLSTFVVLAKSECHRLMPENDYSKRLRQLPLANIETYFVSPSEFQFINQSTLTSHLLSPERWSGLILTSTRCIDAIVHLWQSIPEEQRKQWASKEIFTVGKSTRDYLLLKLNLDSIGYESGNSQLLAEFIANRDRIRPLLYPCSCIRSETLGTVLTGMVEEVACYETIANRRISEDLAELKVELAKFDPTNLTVIIVFFSPSGVKHLLEPLQNLVLPSLVESTVKYVAFGKQTQDRMLHSGLEVEEKPAHRVMLESWLNKNMKIKLSDNRTIVGIFLCTDCHRNIILGCSLEYLTDDLSDEPRVLGLAMTPGKHIVSIQVDEIVSA